jgi:hypothetical protein
MNATVPHTTDKTGKLEKLLRLVNLDKKATDYENHDSRKETTRHQHIRRKIRRPTENATHKGGTHARRSGGRNRSDGNHRLSLGIHFTPTSNFGLAQNCRRTGSKSPNSTARKIIYDIRKFPLDYIYEYRKMSCVTSLAYGDAFLLDKDTSRFPAAPRRDNFGELRYRLLAIFDIWSAFDRNRLAVRNKKTPMSLFLLESLHDVIEAVELIEPPAARTVFLASCLGITDQRVYERWFSRLTVRKTCQYLVANGLLDGNLLTKSGNLLTIFGKNFTNSAPNLINSNQFNSNLIGKNQKLKKIDSDSDSDSGLDWDASDFSHSPVGDPLYEKFFEYLPEKERPPRYRTKYRLHTEPGRKTIETVDEIPDIILHLTEHDKKLFNQNQKYLLNHFKERHLSLELIDRIVMMPITITQKPTVKTFDLWKRHCEEYKSEDSANKGWSCLAGIIEEEYTACKVLWTPCRRTCD